MDRNADQGDCVSRYVADIRTMHRLSKDEESVLAQQAAGGCQDAIRDLIESNLGFVIQVAREFRNLGVPFEDLVSSGNMGLVRAARRFDGQRGNRFITYAVFWISKSIIETLYQSPLVRLPQYQIRRLKNDAGDGTVVRPRALSIDAPRDEDPHRSLVHRLSATVEDPEQELLRSERVLLLRRAMTGLTERERFIIDSRFGFDGLTPLSREQIGRRLGVSRERVRQIEEEVLARLRRRLAARASAPPDRELRRAQDIFGRRRGRTRLARPAVRHRSGSPTHDRHE